VTAASCRAEGCPWKERRRQLRNLADRTEGLSAAVRLGGPVSAGLSGEVSARMYSIPVFEVRLPIGD